MRPVWLITAFAAAAAGAVPLTPRVTVQVVPTTFVTVICSVPIRMVKGVEGKPALEATVMFWLLPAAATKMAPLRVVEAPMPGASGTA